MGRTVVVDFGKMGPETEKNPGSLGDAGCENLVLGVQLSVDRVHMGRKKEYYDFNGAHSLAGPKNAGESSSRQTSSPGQTSD